MADYADNNELIRRSRDGDEGATEELIKKNYALALSVAKRFTGRGCELEDLIQLALFGMLKAIRTFDFSRGCVFSTYAVPLIMGEIRKFLRDDGMIKVSRETKKSGAIIMRAMENYISEHGCEPSLKKLSEITGIDVCDIGNILAAARPVSSLQDKIGDDPALTVENTVEDSDASIEKVFDRIALSDALSELPADQRRIIILRYFRDYSQQQVADAMGLSQVKVSREEKKIIAFLRRKIC